MAVTICCNHSPLYLFQVTQTRVQFKNVFGRKKYWPNSYSGGTRRDFVFGRWILSSGVTLPVELIPKNECVSAIQSPITERSLLPHTLKNSKFWVCRADSFKTAFPNCHESWLLLVHPPNYSSKSEPCTWVSCSNPTSHTITHSFVHEYKSI